MKWLFDPHRARSRARPTFSEAWFHQRYGLTFGEKYCFDPRARTEQDREARRLLHDHFGAIGLGESDPQPPPHLEICGHRLMPALLGGEIHYQDDQAAAAIHHPAESPADYAAVQKPDWATNRWAVEFPGKPP